MAKRRTVDAEILPTAEDIDQEKARRHLRHFVRYMWPVLNPGTPLIWGWPLEVICDHLEAVTRGEIKDLIICIPPRFLKSTIVSVMWPAWEWLTRPELRYLTAAYDLKLATRDAVKSRRLMNSPRYRALNSSPSGEVLWEFTGDQNTKTRYENDKTGERLVTSPAGGALGEGGDRIVVDDPHNPKAIESDDQRKDTIEWWDQIMSTRRNDLKTAARIIMMQRLHDNDLAGHCIEKGGYELVCLPLMFEAKHPTPSVTSLGLEDPRTREGELLLPDRIGPDEARALRVDQGTVVFLAQQQQRPSPPEGGILKRAWFKRYDVQPPEFDRLITSWDLSFKGTDKEQLKAVRELSYVHGAVVGFIGSRSFVLDEERGQWDIIDALAAMFRLLKRWPEATTHLIEDKANGPAIQSMIKGKVSGVIMVEPKGSKIQRAYAIAPLVEAGNVWVPDERRSPWTVDWLHEVSNFPFAKDNDRVDTLTQAVIWQHVKEGGSSLGRLEKLVAGLTNR